MREPGYAELRHGVFQALAAASVYSAWGKTVEAKECSDLAVRIMASMSAADFETLRSEIRRARRIQGYRKTR